MATQTGGRVRRRERKNITSGVAHINATFNNTMITITDVQGNAIAWSSAGGHGLPRLAQIDALCRAACRRGRRAARPSEHGMKTLEINVKGPGSGRESALRALQRGRFRHHRDPRRDADTRTTAAGRRKRRRV